MFLRRLIRFLSVIGLFAILAASMKAGERSAPEKDRISVKECEKLVKKLVNPNKPPFDKDYVLKPPKGQDKKALMEIQKAYNKLSDNIEVSLPVLVRNAHDDRYSYVREEYGTSGAFVKASVGYACRQIIDVHVEVHQCHTTKPDFASIPRSISFILACGGYKSWLKDRKGKTLADLQLEGAEWALRQEKPRHFASDKEWAGAKQSLTKMAERIRTSKRPIKVEHHLRNIEY